MENYKFNLLRSPIDERDLLLESVYPVEVNLPEEWDMRSNLPPVRDQGTQGTCSAQTAATMKEWQERQDINFIEHMSPQFIYNLRPNQESDGMYPRDTMDILNKIGIVSEKDYTYGNSKKPSKDLLEKASKFQIAGYAQINTIDSLKKALYANGPCYIAFPVYNSSKMEIWKPDFAGQRSQGGHAVTVVGWNKDSFIIRNSWSSNWGDRGYTYYKFVDWGMHWECWTTIDADSNPEGLLKKIQMRNNTNKEKKKWLFDIIRKKLKNNR
jgi:C1A family cysteine protease